jgi:(2R)-3-sulfolactate dehydrogenase (NADP+)
MARSKTITLSVEAALALCTDAAIAAGASDVVASSIARSVVAAEADGQQSVGLAHFIDYIEALEAGRIDGQAVPVMTRPALALFQCDARGGAAQPGFDMAFDDFVRAAKLFGVAIFSQKNAYTCGSLGTFAERLAEAGLVAIAATNGPPLLAGSGSAKPVYCTNPLAFAAPVADGPPLVIDQASSATAFVNIREAANAGDTIPEGWALDANGKPTTDAKEAVKGALLAYGGPRGANIALMVEVLAAGLTGANWSLDAPDFASGSKSPGAGLFVIAMSPSLLDPDSAIRMKAQLDRLHSEYGVHIPGRAKAAARDTAARNGVTIPRAIHDRIAQAASRLHA